MTTSHNETTATVKIWDGYFDGLPSHDPDASHELEIYDGGDYSRRSPVGPEPDAETWLFSEDISYYSGPIEIHLETETSAWLFVHTNDSYHTPDDWGRPVEQGLRYGPDIRETDPFGCEIWGRVVMWVARRET